MTFEVINYNRDYIFETTPKLAYQIFIVDNTPFVLFFAAIYMQSYTSKLLSSGMVTKRIETILRISDELLFFDAAVVLVLINNLKYVNIHTIRIL